MARSLVLRLLPILGLALTTAVSAQVLPPHPPLRILIVSDEVNPHGLPPEDLTQPGEISAALLGVPGLNLDAGADPVLEIGTDDLADATALLQLPTTDPGAYDVLIYFAHRVPDVPNGQILLNAIVWAAAYADGELIFGDGFESGDPSLWD